MLSGWEHRRLSDIEHQLELEDPGLANKLSRTPAPSPRGRSGWVLDAAIGVMTLLGAVAVLVGAYRQALGIAVTAGVLAWICYGSGLTRLTAQRQRRHHAESQAKPPRQGPPMTPPDHDTRL